MAKTNENFDRLFREKLEGHREKPSALAWERLESQLPKESKPTLGVWWAVAASVTALLVAGYAFWPSEEKKQDEILVAEQTELPQENTAQPIEQMVPIDESTNGTGVLTEALDPANPSETKPKSTQNTKPTRSPALNQAPAQLIAQAENPQTEPQNTSAILEPKAEEVSATVPELMSPEIEKTVAEAKPSEEDEPLYRVSIYSNGIKKGEPAEKNLITELGKTVGQVEGLLGKVDDGLITLQDKKDNLFASLTNRKSQADEKP